MNPGNGYLYVAIHGGPKQISRSVHSLVAEVFIGPCPLGQEVRHKNGVRTDVFADNLFYGTRTQNAADKVEHGTHRAGIAIKHFVKLTETDVLNIRNEFALGARLPSLAQKYHVTVSNIRAIVRRKSWKHI